MTITIEKYTELCSRFSTEPINETLYASEASCLLTDQDKASLRHWLGINAQLSDWYRFKEKEVGIAIAFPALYGIYTWLKEAEQKLEKETDAIKNGEINETD